MKIEDLKVGRVYRAKRPRVVHTLGGSKVMVIFGQHWNWKRRKTMTKEELMNAITGLPAETQVYKIDDYVDIDRSDGFPLLGVIVVNEPDSKPVFI